MIKNMSTPAIGIPYRSHRFPHGRISQHQNPLLIEVQELIWAAITVGRANMLDVLAHGHYSEFELIYRLSILLANLTTTRQNRLAKSAAFLHLDPSEKSAISYFLGLTMSKLFAEKLLKVPWLLHLDVYRDQLGVTAGVGVRQKPDLLGLSDANDWIVLESKGRANGLTAGLLQKGKTQTRMIRSIAGKRPRLRISAVTHFVKGNLHFDWLDPEDEAEDAIDLKTTLNDYLLLYYRLIYTTLSSHEAQNNNGFRVYTFADLGISVGLLESIFQAYSQQRLEIIEAPIGREFNRLPIVANQRFYVGRDGIAVGVSPDIRKRLIYQ